MSGSYSVHKLLETLYHAYFVIGEPYDLTRWADADMPEAQCIGQLFNELRERGLVCYVVDTYVKLTAQGILYAEDNGIAPTALAAHNRRVRAMLLDALATHTERHRQDSGVPWQMLLRLARVKPIDFERNYQLMVSYGLIEWSTPGCLQITNLGRERVPDYRGILASQAQR